MDVFLPKSFDDPANLLLGVITNSVDALLEVKRLSGWISEIWFVPEPIRQRLDVGHGFEYGLGSRRDLTYNRIGLDHR